jgi:NhaA family Na+:H+ antiporter
MHKLAKRLLIGPFQKFFEGSASGGNLLILAAVIAFAFANSPFAEVYHAFWHTPLTIGFGTFSLSEPLHFWINDALMAVFFFVVGLEIKRELMVGELSTPSQASLPLAAAAGGMLLPGLLYTSLNPPGTPYFAGWGIPTVTDIAFAIGVLALLGNRVPLPLKVFLTALAIVDDLGAILIIALFYSKGIQVVYLGLALLLMALLLLANRLGVRRLYCYIVPGILLWLMMLFSGVHATIAGVLLALTIPAKSLIDAGRFSEEGQASLNQIQKLCERSENCSPLTETDYQANIQHIESLCEEVQSPLQRLEHALAPWVNHFIMPVFALANAGVTVNAAELGRLVTHPIALGVMLGLVVGKQAGIFLFTWGAIRTGLARMPLGLTWGQLYGAAWLGGIGFTMSIFITELAFPTQALADTAKLGILTASVTCGTVGWLLLRKLLPQTTEISAQQESA